MKVVFAFLLVFSALSASAESVPDIPSRVVSINDYADIIPHSSETEMENLLSGFRDTSGFEIILVTFSDPLTGSFAGFSSERVSRWEKAGIISPATILMFINTVEGRLTSAYGSGIPSEIKNQLSGYVELRELSEDPVSDVLLSIHQTMQIISGKMSEEFFPTSSILLVGILLLLFLFFFLVFPLLQYKNFKKQHFSSRPVNIMRALVLHNSMGNSNIKGFDEFSSSRLFSASNAPELYVTGGGGAEGSW